MIGILIPQRTFLREVLRVLDEGKLVIALMGDKRISTESCFKKVEEFFDSIDLKDQTARLEEAVSDVAEWSRKMAIGEADQEQTALSIAYKFAYVFMKEQRDILNDVVGIVAMSRNGDYFVRGYQTNEEYEEVSSLLKIMAEDFEYIDIDDDPMVVTNKIKNFLKQPVLH